MTQSPAQDTPPGGQRRRRKPPRRATVTSVSRIVPRLVSVLVTGDELDGFSDAAPTAHLKLFLPPAGSDTLLLPEQAPDGSQVWNHDESLRPVIRTYTPRRYDPATKTLEIQLVLHGVGPASEWAERVKPGDEVAVGGPGGRFVLDETAERWWLAADESAIPAVGTLLDALPETASAEVHIEVEGPDDEVELPSAAKTTVVWHHRKDAGAFGAELDQAARDAELAEGTRIWVACEAAAMRGIRRYFTRERGLPASSLVTRGYWRIGEQNHPDHDYGED